MGWVAWNFLKMGEVVVETEMRGGFEGNKLKDDVRLACVPCTKHGIYSHTTVIRPVTREFMRNNHHTSPTPP